MNGHLLYFGFSMSLYKFKKTHAQFVSVFHYICLYWATFRLEKLASGMNELVQHLPLRLKVAGSIPAADNEREDVKKHESF